MKKKARLFLFLGAAATLFAASPSIVTRQGWIGTGQQYAYGGPFEIYYQAVPTSLTDVDTRDSRLIGYCFSNNSGGALTITIQTKDASPLPLPIGGQSIAANTVVCNNAPFGILSKGGFSVQASGAGLNYSVIWTH